jgi:hypothetical protein
MDVRVKITALPELPAIASQDEWATCPYEIKIGIAVDFPSSQRL